ncbi:hypothetical protein T492DRAFT_1025777 [Pavlovales sp. CCMP2436]|nr:hypothetical protein T492DRAFT_1103304 [Pavlovales sp. CCMP2436]KAJ1627306.1 hypothetical protein T492DRAFT_1025777 [Pavlovales sp. CCMP2436]
MLVCLTDGASEQPQAAAEPAAAGAGTPQCANRPPHARRRAARRGGGCAGSGRESGREPGREPGPASPGPAREVRLCRPLPCGPRVRAQRRRGDRARRLLRRRDGAPRGRQLERNDARVRRPRRAPARPAHHNRWAPGQLHPRLCAAAQVCWRLHGRPGHGQAARPAHAVPTHRPRCAAREPQLQPRARFRPRPRA